MIGEPTEEFFLYLENYRLKDEIELLCPVCHKTFDRTKRSILHGLKWNRQAKRLYCSTSCAGKSRNNKSPFQCLTCGIDIEKTPGQLKQSKSGNIFCGTSCRAIYTNKNRIVQNTVDKNANCKRCGDSILINRRANENNVFCKGCKEIRNKEYTEKSNKNYPPHPCISCGEIIIGTGRKTCSEECKKRRQIFSGQKSAQVQSEFRRSKNEIYFHKLCTKHYDNVDANEPIFNGWDADVIIHDVKVAVLWNGKWHYEKITEQHSVEQVQNRDRIKTKEIKKCGYKPYVIKDMGSHDKEFVKKEFEKFLSKMADA